MPTSAGLVYKRKMPLSGQTKLLSKPATALLWWLKAGRGTGHFFDVGSSWSRSVGFAFLLAGAGLWAQAAPLGNGLLTPAQKAWLEQHPNIRLAPTPDYQPVEFFDASENYSGMTAEYFQLIEQRLGYRFKIVRPTPEQWAQLDPDLRGADVISASAPTPKRDVFWSVTAPYLELPAYVITRENVVDGLTPAKLGGSRVAVVRGWAAEEYLRTTWTNLVIVPVVDAREGLRQVSFGLVDAFVSELPVATAWMEREGISNLKASAEAGYTYRLGISVRRDWPELRVILEQALASITPDQRRQIFDHWVKLKTPAERRLEKNRQRWGWVAGGLATLLAAALLWNRLLSWRVRAHARELQLSEEKFSKAFRASPDGLAISELATGRYLEVNDGYCALYGYRREEMLGRTSLELDIWADPRDRDRFVAEVKARGGARNLEVNTRTRTGGSRTIQLSGEPIEVAGVACVLTVLHDITDQIQAETERAQAVAREQAARIEYTLRLIAAQEAERERIASELHDSLGQNLSLIKNLAGLALRSNPPAKMMEQTSAINELAAQCIAEVRRISRDLRQPQLEHLGLKRALEAMVEQTAQASRIQFTSRLEMVDDLFGRDDATSLYRIIQESLNNILKHAQATHVDLCLERDIHEVQLRIADDGVGFDLNPHGEHKGLGLQNIAQRALMLGGKLSISSSPGSGTRIELTIPVSNQPGEETV